MQHIRPGTAVILQETGRAVAESGVLIKAKPTKKDQGNFLFNDLLDQLNPKDPLLKLAAVFPWGRSSRSFPASTASTVDRQSPSCSWSAS